MGYLGYQLSRRLERLPAPPPRPARLPEHHLGFYDHVLRRRPATGTGCSSGGPGPIRPGRPRPAGSSGRRWRARAARRPTGAGPSARTPPRRSTPPP
ncbi:hypothetical protein [Kocuria sp. CNJ-770]|uniref:hypothetical protein n=1 Tax=Kocuria sp. CNJ-770 TaxID=1904964 RepID=UPI0035148E36